MKITHQALFTKMQDTEVIRKSEQYAHWTLASLMADLKSMTRATLERDYQEIGALLTNNLASKLAGILFPSTRPFFKIAPSADMIELAQGKGIPKDKLLSSLASMEVDACTLLFKNASFNQLILALKHLIVTGNVLTYRDTEQHRTITYGIRSYVTRRDGKGRLLDCVLKEHTFVEALPMDLQHVLRLHSPSKYSRPEQTVDVFTRIHRTQNASGDQLFEVTQEVDTVPVGTLGTYPEHLCPWHAVTWNLIPGEHYGRGLVEDYAGGFAKLSDLSEAHALYSVEVMRVLHLVRAGSGTDIDDFATAETGEYLVGDKESVYAHESGDGQKLQKVASEIAQISTRLSTAFMYTANTRDAERVTKYELAQLAKEAENTLGGTYSALADSWQVPLSHVLLYESEPAALTNLIDGSVQLDVIAGIPALGRAADVQNLVNATQVAAAIIPSLTQLDRRIDPARVFDMIMSSESVDTAVLYKDQQQLDAAAQAEAQMAQGQQQMLQAQQQTEQAKQIEQLQQGAL